MYSPAEDPRIETYLEGQADKLGSYDAAWTETERKFDVVRPVIGDAAVFAANVEKPGRVDWDAVADQEGGIEYAAPARLTARAQDHAAHNRNNFLSGVMSADEKQAQQKINAARPRMPWEQ